MSFSVDSATGALKYKQVSVQTLECEPNDPVKYWLAFPEKIVLNRELEALIRRFRLLTSAEQLSVQRVLRGILEPTVRGLYSDLEYYRVCYYEKFRDTVFVSLRNVLFLKRWERWKGEQGFREKVKETFRRLIQVFN